MLPPLPKDRLRILASVLAGSLLSAWLYPVVPAASSVDQVLVLRDGLSSDPDAPVVAGGGVVVGAGGLVVVPEGAASFWDRFFPRPFVVMGQKKDDAHPDISLVYARSNGTLLLSTSRLYRLSATEDAAEERLVAMPGGAAWVTRYGAHLTGLSFMDFSGDLRPEGEPLLVSVQRDIENLVRVGRVRGYGLRQFFLEPPPDELELIYIPGGGGLELRFPDGPTARVLFSGEVTGEAASRLRPRPPPEPDSDPVAWLVNTAREIPWIGADRIEDAKTLAFALQDFLKRQTADTESMASGDALEEVVPSIEVAEASINLGSPLDGPPSTGTGWEPIAFAPQPEGLPPIFWTTTIKPDAERPFAWVRLVAIDARQVELHMMGGSEHPRSSAGFADLGQIPTNPETRSRLLAAFQGGFQAIHGSYGMKTERGVLLPPRPNIATVAVAKSGEIRFGAWPEENGRAAPIPESIVSLRQNLNVLVGDGQFNPKKIQHWGYTIKGDDAVYTWRSGFGVTREGRLLYAVGPSLSAATLAKAMIEAGALWAMHLDMNVSNVHFELYRPTGIGSLLTPGPGIRIGAAPARLAADLSDATMLTTAMYRPRFPRYLGVYQRDFFYLLRREAGMILSGLGEGAGEWEAESVGSPPGWQAKAVHSWIKPDPEHPEDQVEVVVLDPESWSAMVGPKPGTGISIKVRGKGEGPFIGVKGELFGENLGLRPLLGAPTVHGGATIKIARFEGEIPAEGMVQGPALVEVGAVKKGGASWESPRQRWGMGLREDGKIVLVVGRVHSERALGLALWRAGVIEGVDLTIGEDCGLKIRGHAPGWLSKEEKAAGTALTAPPEFTGLYLTFSSRPRPERVTVDTFLNP